MEDEEIISEIEKKKELQGNRWKRCLNSKKLSSYELDEVMLNDY